MLPSSFYQLQSTPISFHSFPSLFVKYLIFVNFLYRSFTLFIWYYLIHDRSLFHNLEGFLRPNIHYKYDIQVININSFCSAGFPTSRRFYMACMPVSESLFWENWDRHFQLFRKSSLLQLTAESVNAAELLYSSPRAMLQQASIYVAKRVCGSSAVCSFLRLWKYHSMQLFMAPLISGWAANSGNGTRRVNMWINWLLFMYILYFQLLKDVQHTCILKGLNYL